MPIQESLHALEIGEGKKWVHVGAIMTCYIALALLYFVTQFRGFNAIEAMDCAQIARQMARGEGYSTKFVRPSALAQLAAQTPDVKVDPLKLPEIMEAPLYPAVLSGVFRIAGTDFDEAPHRMMEEQIYGPERPIVIFNLLCLFFTAIALYLLAARLFDARVAFLAAAAFVGCDLMWQLAISGISTSMIMLFITVLLASLNEGLRAEEEGRGMAAILWVGLSAVMLLGAILSRLTLLALAIPYFAFLFFSFRHRLLAPLLALVLVAVGVTPWLYRNAAVSGSLFGGGLTLALEDTSGKISSERSYTYDPDAIWVATVQRKSIYGFRYTFAHSFELLGASAIVLMFGASLLHPFKRSRARWLRLFLVIGGLFLVFGGSLVRSQPEPVDDVNNLVLFWPGLAIFGAAFFYVLLERLDLRMVFARFAVIGLFLLVCALPMAFTLKPPRPSPYRYPPYFPPMIRTVSQMLKPDEIIMSDMPWATAWYGDRASLWLPRDLKEFFAIHDSLHPVSGLLLTPVSWQWSLMDVVRSESDWAPLLNRQTVPRGFPLDAATALPPNRNEYLFFSDRMRWREQQ